MDYSLLVGIDEERKELVMGIIDYLRQYTWDKQLETWVKASGFLGGSKDVLPTIISPDQYKKRFRKAMSKYFLTLPDQWSPWRLRWIQAIQARWGQHFGFFSFFPLLFLLDLEQWIHLCLLYVIFVHNRQDELCRDCGDCCPSRQRLGVNTCTYPTL